MGDTVKYIRLLKLTMIISILFVTVWFGYPVFDRYVKAHFYTIDYYVYKPSRNVFAARLQLQAYQEPGKAVPILMYHGVTNKKDNDNTQIKKFIQQMEMLKMNGYQTITLDQFYEFLNGNYDLPPKPVIITFDDGRKDSYYTTDDVLKKLGFSAAMFLVSGKPNDNDTFYLSWDELKKMKESGRWDIQSHGTYSHDLIPVDSNGNTGRFLYSRKADLINGLLEDISEYEKRVENDYVNNINDIKNHLGHTPFYYAVPLNYFGTRIVTNYAGSEDFNNQVKSKYYRLAFVETYTSDDETQDITKLSQPIYNYRDVDRLHVARIEVKNMDADKLIKLLDYYYPSVPRFDLAQFAEGGVLDNAKDYFGAYSITKDGLEISTGADADNARIVFGDAHWEDFTYHVDLKRLAGNSASIILGMKDNKNYVSYGISGNRLFITKTEDGVDTELVEPYLFQNISQEYSFSLKVIKNGNKSDFYINDLLFTSGIALPSSVGFTGVRIWSEDGNARSLVRDIKIYPNT